MWRKEKPSDGCWSLSGDPLFRGVAMLGDWLHKGKLMKYIPVLRIHFQATKDNETQVSHYQKRELPMRKRRKLD